ncbi:hypothetical protein TNCV_4414491 [Trichonephila clavipes]|uniref:Uncharacterized protein n=1 Tax=Trichonephila clavipes TaxID=2585209 RepID=A0A8X6S0X2_TRICX|nr:hypothetical protein TNCV_4414491 [Trichonephila clavipes]
MVFGWAKNIVDESIRAEPKKVLQIDDRSIPYARRSPLQILFFAERVNKSAATYQSGPSVLPMITPPGKQSPRRLITLSTHGAAPALPDFFFFCLRKTIALAIHYGAFQLEPWRPFFLSSEEENPQNSA